MKCHKSLMTNQSFVIPADNEYMNAALVKKITKVIKE